MNLARSSTVLVASPSAFDTSTPTLSRWPEVDAMSRVLDDLLADARALEPLVEAVGTLTEALRAGDTGTAAAATAVLVDRGPVRLRHATEPFAGLEQLVFALADALEDRLLGADPAPADEVTQWMCGTADPVAADVLAVAAVYSLRFEDWGAERTLLENRLADQPVMQILRRRHAAAGPTATVAQDLLFIAERRRVDLTEVVLAAGQVLVAVTCEPALG